VGTPPPPPSDAATGAVRVVCLAAAAGGVAGGGGGEDVAPMELAHFFAHTAGSAVAVLEFNPSGTLLATADANGQHIHVFSFRCDAMRGVGGV